jgi:hypothetical protein
MPETDPAYRFNDGAAYERFMGRWSRGAGKVFLDWIAAARWLDVGCGTGSFTELIVNMRSPWVRGSRYAFRAAIGQCADMPVPSNISFPLIIHAERAQRKPDGSSTRTNHAPFKGRSKATPRTEMALRTAVGASHQATYRPRARETSRAWFVSSMKRSIAVSSSATERKTPCCSRCLDNFAKYPSTALSQEQDVGVK